MLLGLSDYHDSIHYHDSLGLFMNKIVHSKKLWWQKTLVNLAVDAQSTELSSAKHILDTCQFFYCLYYTLVNSLTICRILVSLTGIK